MNSLILERLRFESSFLRNFLVCGPFGYLESNLYTYRHRRKQANISSRSLVILTRLCSRPITFVMRSRRCAEFVTAQHSGLAIQCSPAVVRKGSEATVKLETIRWTLIHFSQPFVSLARQIAKAPITRCDITAPNLPASGPCAWHAMWLPRGRKSRAFCR